MKKARCTASLFVSCDYHTTPSPSWKKPHTRVRYSGIFSVGSPLEFDSRTARKSCGLCRSRRLRATDAPIRDGGTGSLRDVYRYHRDNRGNCRRRRTNVLHTAAPFRADASRAAAVRVDQPLCLRNGKTALFRNDLRRNKQCPGIPGQVLLDIEIEGRTSPTASIVRTGAAATLETLGIAETGDIIGDGNRHAEIFGSVWDHISVKRSN